ncbi:MAG: hypothetical protein GY705_30365, partial [Bacteroidetes bacterium]|nr:hypothetical protein [Bacteroidota bacterium]
MKKLIASIILFYLIISPTYSQIYFSINGNDLGILYPKTCQYDYFYNVIPLERSIHDIALHPDGKLFGIRNVDDQDKSYLLEINLQKKEIADTVIIFPDRCSALAIDKNGIFYTGGAKKRIISYDPNTSGPIIHGELPSLDYLTGDLYFNGDDLIGAACQLPFCTEPKIYKINWDNPHDSEILFYQPDSITNTVAITSYWDVLSQQKKVITSTQSDFGEEDISKIYEVDLNTGTFVKICDIDLPSYFEILGLTSTDEFRTNFHFQLDLDDDDSSGRLIDHFEIDSLCTLEFPICDTDVAILSQEGNVDSLAVFLYSGIQHPGEEEIIGTPNVGINMEGNGTQRLVLKNEGTATSTDFEAALQNIHFLITNTDVTAGERVVACVLYADGEASDTAKAFIYVDLDTEFYAGEDGSVEVCEEGNSANMFEALGENAMEDGYWVPELSNIGTYHEDFFNTHLDEPGTYYYIVQEGTCTGDTAEVEVIMHPKPEPAIIYEVLYLCDGDVLEVDLTTEGVSEYYWYELDSDEPVQQITEANTYNFRFITDAGCEYWYSIWVVPLWGEPVTLTEERQLCQGEAFEWEGQEYQSDTLLCTTFEQYPKCDSTHCLQLTFHPTYQFYDIYTFCDEGVDYVVEGVKVERDTSFCAYYTSSQTCDSIRCVEVVFEPLPQEEEWVIMCRGESYEWQGQALDNDTTFCLTYTGSNGCDSTWCLNLEFSESYVFYDSYNFCQDGADYLVEDVKVEQDTSFCVNYVSLAGCDSLRCLEVIF